MSPLFKAPAAEHGIIAGIIDVEQVSTNDDNVANVSLAYGIGTFQLSGGNRGDYNVRIAPGIEASYDDVRGILLSSVAQNGRDNFGTNAYPSSCVAQNGSGTYRVVSNVSPGPEYNVNVAAAWFPYDSYLAGLAKNATDANGGANNLLTGSPGLVLGTHFKSVASGRFTIDLRSFGIDSRLHGVLLVNHGKDEDNYALSQVNTTDGTWNVFVRDIGESNFSAYEQDPVAFVYIPRTNSALVSGRFNGDGTIAMHSGASAAFTVTNLGTGRWDLRIPGYSSTNGVLLISAEGGGSANADNIVSYQAYPDGSGWEIQSRDTPGNGLQTPTGPLGAAEAVASFAFIPAVQPGFTVSPTSGLVTSGSGEVARFGVRLKTKPASLVSINLASSDSTKGIPDTGTLVFSPSDWHVPQTITVTGKAGAAHGPYMIVLGLASSADLRYKGLNPPDVNLLSLAARALLQAPASNSASAGVAPLLQVQVTNTFPGNLTVKFFGRPAPTLLPGPDFTLAVLPDTQMYTGQLGGGKKEMFIAQTEWCINNRTGRNIPYVTQLGDISNNGDSPSHISQWYNATNAMYRLENPVRTQLPDGMPYGVAVGNHEITPIGYAAAGSTSNYNRYFGVSHFAGRDYYVGHYGTNNNNHYDFFSAGGMDFLVLYFEYNTNPPTQLLAWADDILRTNANRRAIIVTHNMGNTQTPVVWSDQAHRIYDALKDRTNLFMMLGGHVTGQGRRDDVYQGRVVRTFVQDYQGWVNGGNGFMRLFEFSPSNNVVVAQTYSPVTGEYLTDEDSEFFFTYDMQPTGPGSAQPFATLTTTNGVAPGALSSWGWTGLEAGKAYEWYVTVTDEGGTTVTSPTWRFTTTLSNSAPTVANLLRTITGDAPATLQLQGNDVNGDALTFTNHTEPTRGLLHVFNGGDGTFTYWPARGFRGSDRFTFSAHDGKTNSGAATMNIQVVAPADTNANSLPDDWESMYGLHSPDQDADGDGQSNLAEYLANTNPTNAASSLKITSAIRDAGGNVTLQWRTVSGTRYRIVYSDITGAGFTGVFTELARDLADEMPAGAPYGNASTQSFTDTTAVTNTAGRFYQIKVVP